MPAFSSVHPLSVLPMPDRNAHNAGAKTGKVHAAAQEFEHVFLSNMLGTMFSGVGGEGPMGDNGPGSTIWRSFLVDQYAGEIAKSGGVGIADQVSRELLSLQETQG
jgi:Rod binding domain-containing protein